VGGGYWTPSSACITPNIFDASNSRKRGWERRGGSMSDIEELPVYAYQLESLQDILDRVSRVGKQAGVDTVRGTLPESPENIAWAFLAIDYAAQRLRSATENATSRAEATVERENSLIREALAQRDDAEKDAELLRVQLEIQKKHTGRARTWATLWKRAAKENRALARHPQQERCAYALCKEAAIHPDPRQRPCVDGCKPLIYCTEHEAFYRALLASPAGEEGEHG
jgi:hypothetical protein